MKFLSLFSGIEAASAAWVPLGWSPVAFAEVEPFPCSVLRSHYPCVPNLGDVTKITRQKIEELGSIDLVCGGFPCQDLSVAGKRKGLMNDDGSSTRSGLFFNAMRIAEWARARWVVLENVPGLFSSNQGRDFAAVAGEMAGCEFDVPAGGWENAGVAVGPLGLVEWATLDAQYVRVESHPRAVPQRRRRVFLVRDSGNWANRPPLFFERESLRGHPAPRRETREGVAGTLSSRTHGGGGLGTDFDLAGGLVSHALRGEGFDASEDGTGRGTPIIAVNQPLDVANCLTRRMDKGFNSTLDEGQTPILVGARAPVVAFPACLSGTQRASSTDVSPALGTLNTMAVAFQSSQSGVRIDSVHATLDGHNGSRRHNGALIGLSVRRLTPLECERLMGFPDCYTAIRINGKPVADGPRYRALGNSWAVNVARWIGERIEQVESIKVTQARNAGFLIQEAT